MTLREGSEIDGGLLPQVRLTVPAMRSAPPSSPARQATTARRTASAWRWERGYVPRVLAADALVALAAALVAYSVRFGAGGTATETVVYAWVTATFPLVWTLAMLLGRAYEPRFLGVGSEEFQRVLSAAVGAIAAIGIITMLLAVDVARSYVLIALPIATVATLLVRYRLRKGLHRRRAHEEEATGVVAVGHVAAVLQLVKQVHSARYHGMRVVGACVPSGQEDPELTDLGVPVLGAFDGVVEAVHASGAAAVAVLPCPELDGPRLRQLGWDLEQTDADLYVAPAVVEVVGPRISIHPVCGLPLLHVERPEFVGLRRFAKSSIDRLVAASALVVLAPLLFVVALAIRLESPGSPLFRQQRVGKDGRLFTMYKLRTMQPDAERRVVDLRDSNEGNGVLFKIREDPRVTRLGRLLRRYSVDELPQLLNVLRGEMSLVGPRPPLQHEVERYGPAMHRRFLVKPGLTGLWQINGRSDLDWDESQRLDVRYVENWSFAFDLMILWKTASAVFRARGAY